MQQCADATKYIVLRGSYTYLLNRSIHPLKADYCEFHWEILLHTILITCILPTDIY